MKIIKPKLYFIIIYCISFFFLLFDTFIGLFQIINIIQEGGGLLSTAKGQFRFVNLFIDLLVLLGMSLFLLNLWRKLFGEGREEPFLIYKKLFISLSIIGGVSLVLNIIFLANPFFLDIDLNVSPIGHIYDATIKIGITFFLLGFTGISLSKLGEQNKDDSINNIKNN
ncbi:MAG: hypothetical protein ACFFBC_12700 [Promethearchaeota archaeon]